MRGSKKFDYGLVLVESLKQAQSNFLEVRAIAEKHGLPRAYLEKIAQEFKRAGLLESRRGRDGGYRLRDPHSVSSATVLSLFLRPYEFCPLLQIKKGGNNYQP